MRLVGLLSTFRRWRFLKYWDAYGGFLEANRGTRARADPLWARILVQLDGQNLPRMLEIKMGRKITNIQLWWKFSPIMVEENLQKNSLVEQKGEGEVVSRAAGCVGVMPTTPQIKPQEHTSGSSIEALTSHQEETFESLPSNDLG